MNNPFETPGRALKRWPVMAALLFFLIYAAAPAAQPLVDATWLHANLSKPNIVVLDLQTPKRYARFHVPGAINSNYADWRKPDDHGTPEMLPAIGELEKLIGGLGIDNQSHVVLVVTGVAAGEMAAATRVYWTFKALGHDAVSILDGGLIAYGNVQGNVLERTVNQAAVRAFRASPRPAYLLDAVTVKASLDGKTTLIDSRSTAEYMGLRSGGGRERPGTIPGAVNLPFDWLTVNGGARFHDRENLNAIFKAAGVATSGEQITFCHTGHRASLSWFVSHELLGNRQARLYDGSTVQWAVDTSLPIDRKISLK